jgi:hypothetical protein
MKKLLLSFALALGVSIAYGQVFTQKTYYEANAGAGELLTPSNNVNSIAYNKVTKKLYVANRGDQIYILDPANYSGTVPSIQTSGLSSLDMTGITDTYRFAKVRVDDDGVIYAVAMQTNGIIYIYRWADENSPVVRTQITDASIVGRVGDSFGLYGTGNNTKLYVAGNAALPTYNGANLYVIDVINGTPTFHGTVDLSAAKYSNSFMDVAKGSISPESSDVLWLGSTDSGVTFRRVKINLTTNTYVSHEVISSTYANFNSMVGEYVQENGLGFFLVAGGKSNSAQNFVNLAATGNVGDATVTMSNRSTFNFSKASYTTNFGYSDIVAIKNTDNTTTFFILSSRNFLASIKSDVVLPVSVSSFSASVVNGQSTLNWETASEANNSGFNILRSNNRTSFAKVGFVASKANGGNSAAPIRYHYVDKSAQAGLNYYQLQQIDLDGKSTTLDKTVSVNISLGGSFVVYPNPASNYINIDAGNADYKGLRYDVVDVNGRVLLSEEANAAQHTMAISSLPAAIYFVKVSKGGSLQKTIKIVKK